MKTIFLLISLVLSVNVSSQNLNCGVKDESPEMELKRNELLSKIKSTPGFKFKSDIITYVPIKMHLFGLDDNTGYADINGINNTIAEMNKQFKPINIEFYFAGSSFNYYPSTTFYNANQTGQEEYNFHLVNGVKNAINLYVSSTVKYPAPNGPIVAGWSNISPGSQSANLLWLDTDYLYNKKATIHEFGHYFGLLHTFNNSASGYIPDRELVTRNFNEIPPRLSANCNNTGDYLCDTPSDPFENGVTIINCKYAGTLTDANSDPFDPSVTNFMAYYGCEPYTFTQGQYTRMSNGLLVVTNPANDFTLDAPETIQDPPNNLTATYDGDYNSDISLSWKDNSNVETGYIIERSTDPTGGFVPCAGVGPNVTKIDNLPEGPNVPTYYRVKASNTKNNYSNLSNPISHKILCSNNAGQSCILDQNPDLAYYLIDDFVLSSNNQVLINNSDSGCSLNGIGNYFNKYSASVIPGQILNFVASSKKSSTNEAATVFVNIYADWNNDNDFDDANELAFASPGTLYQVFGEFVVPANISQGDIRLRVALSAGAGISSPCEASFGEIEDYKLNYNPLSTLDSPFSHELKIFPNPAKTILNLKNYQNYQIDKTIVTDLSGKTIKTQLENTTQIDVQNLAKGMYIIQAFSGQMKWQGKFIKE